MTTTRRRSIGPVRSMISGRPIASYVAIAAASSWALTHRPSGAADLAQPQAVGVGMLLGGDDLGDLHPRPQWTALLHPFDLDARHHECVAELVEGQHDLDELPQPVERQLHGRITSELP